MDDLLDNFANNDPPPRVESPEENYIYHFVDESPAPLEHSRPVHHTTAAEPNNYTSFFNIESPTPYQSTRREIDDEGDYSVDVDDDDDYDDGDDDVFGRGLHRASQFGAYPENPIVDTSDNGEPLSINNITGLDRSYQRTNDRFIELHDLSGRKESGHIKLASALDDDEQDLHGFKQHLRKFHRQDIERDDLLTVRALPSPLDPGAC